MKDIVIVSVPYTDTTAPIMAPAALKAAVTKAGFGAAAFDLNAEVVKFVTEHPDKFYFQEFFYFERFDSRIEKDLVELFDHMTKRILSHNPRIVALSLLHYQCQVAGKWLSMCLKKANPDIKIVMGGTGIVSELVSTDESYVQHLKKLGLIDHYIRGDGEHALVELVNGNVTAPGIDSNQWKEIEDLDNLPYPDYDEYDFSLYQSPFIGILGSRGCVRQCTFCDVHEHWNKFRFRDAEKIFQEMLYQNKKYNARFFKFQDSLINGSIKQYDRLIRLLADHNKKNPDNKLTWSSYFIFRPAEQMNEETWRLTAESGAYILSVGVESLVDKNRHHLKKKFNNDDVDFGLKMAKKYGVKIFFITLVGYVTETEQDHQETLQWLIDNKHYANDPVVRLSVGGTLAILPNTWLHRNQKSLGVVWLKGDDNPMTGKNHLWHIPETNNTYEVRVRRMHEIIKVGQDHGWEIHKSVIDPQKEMENMLKGRMAQSYERSSHI